MFADDTSVHVTEKSGLALQNKLQEAVNKLASWFKAWAITINHAKSVAMVISKKRNPIKLDIHIDDMPIPQANSHKHLGLVLNSKLSWSDHVEHIRSKAAKKVGLLRRIRKQLPSLVLRTLYITCIRPTLEYATVEHGEASVHMMMTNWSDFRGAQLASLPTSPYKTNFRTKSFSPEADSEN